MVSATCREWKKKKENLVNKNSVAVMVVSTIVLTAFRDEKKKKRIDRVGGWRGAKEVRVQFENRKKSSRRVYKVL